MKKALLLGVALAMTVLGGPARAAIPRTINFQGRLADASGTPLTGSYSITFRIFDAASGGGACHGAAQTVAVNSGLFNVLIGDPSGISTACDFSVPYWLELQVGTDSPMSPRLPVTSVAYAFRADQANNSALLGGYAAGNASGQVPLNNGAWNTNLYAAWSQNAQWSTNSDMVDGQHANAFAPAGHNHRSSITLYSCVCGARSDPVWIGAPFPASPPVGQCCQETCGADSNCSCVYNYTGCTPVAYMHN